MLAAFKEVLLPYLVYLTIVLACAIGIAKRAELPVFLLAILAPVPTLWYPIQGFPFGKDTMDLLIASAVVGAWVQRPKDAPGPRPTAEHSGFIWLLVLVSYIAVWKVTFRFGLSMPVTRDNPVLADWKNFAMMMLLYVVVFNAVKTRQHLHTLTMIMISVVLFMVWREFSSFVAGESFSYNRRANGPFWIIGLNANHFGAFIAHFAVFALGMYAVDTHKFRRRLYLATFIGSLYPLFYSYSRGAYVAVLAALLVLGVLRWRLMLLLLTVFMFTWAEVLPDSVVDRINTTEGEDGELEESAALRIVVWDLAKKLFSDNPIFGIGFDGFYFASEGLRLRNVHNYYLQTLAEQGIVGIVLLLALFGKAAHSGWRLYRDGDTDFFKALGLGFVTCTVAVMVTNVFGDRFSQLALGASFFILFGMIDRARWLSRNEPIAAVASAERAPSGEVADEHEDAAAHGPTAPRPGQLANSAPG